jgi:ABC-type branched-subunit amino acid transport system substrate-binding protein
MQAEPTRGNPRSLPSIESALVTAGVLGLVVLLLAALNAFPAVDRESIVATDGPVGASVESDGIAFDDPSTPEAEGEAAASTGGGDRRSGATGGRATGTNSATGSSGGGPAQAGACKGGATDVGVSANEIKLGSTVVDSGIGSSFLGAVRVGMVAVQQKVNRAGGICGRKLKLIMKDDGWDRQRGRQFLLNLVEDEKVFALAVVPSSEGLDNVADDIDRLGVPVVGTDGMLISQYTKKWIWPVATSTMSLMRIIAKDAYDRGARQFSLVYDRKYRFGIEGAYAFNQAVKRLTGADVPGYHDPFADPKCDQRFCAIEAGASSYNDKTRTLTEGCEPNIGARDGCDFNALLLEPNEALTWYNSGGRTPQYFTAGGFGAAAAQPLFTKTFAVNCQKTCDQLVVWTGFNPPIERFAGLPTVQQYVNDVKAQSPNVDVNNQFLEGGYLGMLVLVDALEQVGADLTRARLRQALDSMTHDVGLTKPLTWTQNHFANRSAQAFRINYTSSFGGWTETTKGWVDDPWVGQDIR